MGKTMITIDKPVCFLLLGPSLKELDAQIESFRDLDVMWVSLNNFYVCNEMLDKIMG